jgi:SIR2-like domain
MNDKDWERLVDQLKNGDCTPLVGPGVAGGSRPIRELSGGWTTSVGYPFADRTDLSRPMRHASVTDRGPGSMRQRVGGDVRTGPHPDFTSPTELHALLAKLPLPVYLTTNPDGFMADALRREGKRPRRAICPWYRGASPGRVGDHAEVFPHPAEPVVYHLHGSIEEPRSLVRTEADHLDFLINLAMDRGADDQRIVPTHILPALTTRPLLFLGYSLRDWTFRFLFQGLLRTVAAVQPSRQVSVQLPPPTAGDDPNDRRRAGEYFAASFERWNVSVFGGTTGEFCAELADRLGWS